MKTNRLIALIFWSLIIFSCKDDDEITTSDIEVGDYSKMIINYYDTTLIGAYNAPEQFILDLNNDEINDILFESEIWGSPAIGGNPTSMITSLNDNVQIYGFHSIDTLFLNKDTSIYTATNNSIEIYHRQNYTYHRIDESDSILKITPKFKVIPLNKGDILNINDTYNATAFKLMDDGYSYIESYSEINSDTTIIEFKDYYNDCYDFPLNEIKYIGVKFENESKLGWIKICLIDKYKILILESGIQK